MYYNLKGIVLNNTFKNFKFENFTLVPCKAGVSENVIL